VWGERWRRERLARLDGWQMVGEGEKANKEDV